MDRRPRWLPAALRALRHAASGCPLASASAPTNAREERRRCLETDDAPRWTYAPAVDAARMEAIEGLATHLRAHAEDPLAALLADRADEIALRGRLAASVGTPRFSALLDGRRPALDDALVVARDWASAPHTPESRGCRTSGPGATLEVALREGLRRARVDWPVVVRPELAALAATGDGFVAVAEDRSLSEEALARTVTHEIEGHVLPRVNAVRSRHVLAGIGGAGGVEAQEGWAILCEERAGHLTASRKHELAWRTIACARMVAGEGFAEVRRALVEEASFAPEAAYALAERLFRGSLGAAPGLGREAAYLMHFLAWKAHLDCRPADEALVRVAAVAPSDCARLGSFLQ